MKMLRQPDEEQQDLEEHILEILSRTNQRQHFVGLLESFSIENLHLQVFDYVDMSLQDYMDHRPHILMLEARPLLYQLLLALKQLQELCIIHADLKPDNIMVNRQGVLKIIDFGASHFVSQIMATPYICTRSYRAPEIILGVSYNMAMDMWSFGCIAAEMLVGVLYNGENELEMLWMMSHNHQFPNGLLNAGLKTRRYFDKINGRWMLKDNDNNGNRLEFRPPAASLENLGSIPCKKMEFIQRKKLADLVIKVLEVEPLHRPSAADALDSDFFNQ